LQLVTPDDGRGSRAALTTIYFLLARGQRSRLHRVKSDEAWHFYEGNPIRMLTCDQRLSRLERVTLGPWDTVSRPTHVVQAGHWQAAESDGDYSLAGCTVAPGFDFADFTMLRDDEVRATQFRAKHADVAMYI
jgi:predicted cupin superfamily sugar epimerase